MAGIAFIGWGDNQFKESKGGHDDITTDLVAVEYRGRFGIHV
jgi:hypothetical protein